jgi:hypothetical protein
MQYYFTVNNCHENENKITIFGIKGNTFFFSVRLEIKKPIGIVINN